MNNKLEPIVFKKKKEVAAGYKILKRDPRHPVAQLLRGEGPMTPLPCFKSALLTGSLAVIAEIKRQSPSKGRIATLADPASLAQRYLLGGANAISVLTDQEFFGGSTEDLIRVASGVKGSLPLLRKDFIIDALQIAEARLAGASAVLCVVAILGRQTKAMIDFARSIGLDALVEINDREELQIALDGGADIIGVNNRNLNSFEVDSNRAFNLVAALPNSVVKVAESGISDPALARAYGQAGFDAVLIGEALVRSADPETFIKECRNGSSFD